MKLFLAGLLAMFFAVAPVLAEDLATPKPDWDHPRKILLQLDSENLDKVNLVLNNALNTQAFYGPDNVKIAIVAFGPGLRAVLKDFERRGPRGFGRLCPCRVPGLWSDDEINAQEGRGLAAGSDDDRSRSADDRRKATQRLGLYSAVTIAILAAASPSPFPERQLSVLKRRGAQPTTQCPHMAHCLRPDAVCPPTAYRQA